MATNSFFSRHTNNEQRVVEDLTIDTIKIHGQDMVYLPRKFVNEDTVFGEDTISKFDDARPIEMYIDSVDGFEGDGDFLGKFGLEIRDSCTLVVSKKRFLETFAYRSDFDRPHEGDLIYFPLTKKLFEITFVEHENPFYQLGKLYTYKLSCEVFTLDASDEITTGITDIDNTIDDRVSVEDDIIQIQDPESSSESGNQSITDFDNNIFDFTENDPFSEGGY